MAWWISSVDGMTIWQALVTSVGISGWVRLFFLFFFFFFAKHIIVGFFFFFFFFCQAHHCGFFCFVFCQAHHCGVFCFVFCQAHHCGDFTENSMLPSIKILFHSLAQSALHNSYI